MRKPPLFLLLLYCSYLSEVAIFTLWGKVAQKWRLSSKFRFSELIFRVAWVAWRIFMRGKNQKKKTKKKTCRNDRSSDFQMLRNQAML